MQKEIIHSTQILVYTQLKLILRICLLLSFALPNFYDTAYIAGNDTLSDNKNFALECKSGFDVGATSIVRTSGLFRPANFANIKIFTGDISNHFGLHCVTGISGAVQIIITGPATYIGTVNGALTQQ